jgi:hypothetical protein
MSDIPIDYRGRLDLADLVSRIERQQEETRKFAAEQHKLTAEAKKFGRDPWFVLAGALLAAAVARLDVIARILGWLP